MKNTSFINKKPPDILWPLSFVGILFATGLTQIVDFDLWWHLITGEIIWRWREIPKIDFFSYTAAGAPWINHEWLYEVIVYLINLTIGIDGLVILKFALTAIIAILAYKTIKLTIDSKAAAMWGLVIIFAGIADRITDRPHVFSIALLIYFFYELRLFVMGKRNWLWHLPLIEIFWFNLHGGGLWAPQIIAAFAFGESFQTIFKSGPSPLAPKKIYHLWLVLILTFVAMCINPYGPRVFSFMMELSQMASIFAYTQEWLLPFDPRLDGIISQIVFKLIFVVTAVSYIINRKNVRLSTLFLTVITSLLLFKGKRFTPDFIVVNIPIIFENFRPLFSRINLRPENSNQYAWCNIILITLVSTLALQFGIPSTIRGGTTGTPGFGVTEQFAPSKMVAFLDYNNIYGHSFHEMGLGGYLMYRRWPRELVFIDGRTPIYGDAFYKDMVDAIELPNNFLALDEKYKFDYLLFKADQAWGIRQFHKFLWENKTWRLVFADPEEGLIYLRDIPKYKYIIDKYAWPKHPIVEKMKEKQ